MEIELRHTGSSSCKERMTHKTKSIKIFFDDWQKLLYLQLKTVNSRKKSIAEIFSVIMKNVDMQRVEQQLKTPSKGDERWKEI